MITEKLRAVNVRTTPIYVAHRGRTICVGQVVGTKFIKHIKGSLHLLRTPPAICLDASSLVEAEAAGATHIEIYDTETHRTYSVALANFKASAFRVTRGDGHQLGLTLDWWSVDGRQSEAERQAEVREARQDAANTVQLTLFGGA